MAKKAGSSGRERGSRGKSGSRPMTQEAAARIQSNSDTSGTNQGFKGRAQRASARNGGER